ncbi:conjugative transposon protein TraM [Proteiniphilum saccharofermentans]|uniref:conjugative transposon protein TraM n=1 Tax=Proteiniphilum saccharofermentans TaxID=1642647 RepID=UPI0028AF3336|nr:conjugative transposon protein TraM [Proteiniphilum saccharofermentans]
MKSMEDNENKQVNILVEDETQNTGTDVLEDGAPNNSNRLTKSIIFALMGVVFLGCMYLIFKPSSNKNNAEEIGLNDVVPQATDAGLQPDKQKAYEQEMFEQRMEENRNALLSLSDYWSEDSNTETEDEQPDEDYGYLYENSNAYRGATRRNSNPAVESYRNVQGTLNSFYDNYDDETEELRKQVEELKEQLAGKDVPPATTLDDQLALMEKSYEMAARYLPSNMGQPNNADTVAMVNTSEKEYFVAFTPERKSTVSALHREPTDSAFLASLSETRNRGFYTAGVSQQVIQPKNSIRAVVQETQVVSDESGVRVRLLETAHTPIRSIPVGTVLTANAKFQGGRLQLRVTSIEFEGNIIPVDITIYDTDGQQGLYVPYSPEMNALTEIASNMSQTSGTSFMMTRSAGQQIAGDLSRGVVQGVSGYFSKKVRTPKVTVKAGHHLFLVSKN